MPGRAGRIGVSWSRGPAGWSAGGVRPAGPGRAGGGPRPLAGAPAAACGSQPARMGFTVSAGPRGKRARPTAVLGEVEQVGVVVGGVRRGSGVVDDVRDGADAA